MIEITNNQINVNFSTEGLTDEQMRDRVQSIQHRMKTVVDKAHALYDNYDVFYSWDDVHDKKTFLGEKENQVCRFCGVKKGEIAAGESKPCTFKKEAHALSNLIGNNHLFSYYECDKCNGELFTKMESHFANFMKLYHCVLKVKGKRGYPSYKNKPDDYSRIDSGSNFKIQQKEDEEPIVEIHEDTNTLIIKGKRTYIPQMVYKCLLKMALTIMPESDIVHFNYALAFLQGKVQYDKNMIVLLSMYREAFPHISCTIYKKKKLSSADVPSYLFCLYYQNVAFQMYLPFCDTDKCLDGKTITIPFVPTPFDIENGPFCQCKLDLSSEEKKEKERCEITLTYERAEVTESANPKVSIIVPVYKVPEQYLRQCIESCINQTMREIEIILVDDGSPDDCGKICDEYAERDARVLVIHKENGGLAAARNTGQDAAIGETLMFLDGDDYLELDCCEIAYSKLKDNDVELVMFDQYVNYPNSQMEQKSFNDGLGERLFVGEECRKLQARVLDFNGRIAMAFMKLIRLDYLRKYNIRHIDELRQGAEGFVFNMQLYEHLERAYYIDKPLLHYIYNGQSISHTASVKNNILIVRCLEWIDEYVKSSRNTMDLHSGVLNRMLYVICTTAITGYFNPYNRQSHKEKVAGLSEFMSEPLVRVAMSNAPREGLNFQRRIILTLISMKMYRAISLLGWLRRKQLENK